MQTPIWLLSVFLVVGGCGVAYDGEAPMSKTAAVGGNEAAVDDENGNGNHAEQNGDIPNPIERKIIYTAEVRLVVEDFGKTEAEVPKLVKQFGGYLANATLGRTQGVNRSGHWVARIPVDNFDPFLTAVENLGVPEHRQQSAQDVTEEFFDLQTRIANKKRLEKRILELLENQAAELKDVIEVERELARVREEVERMEGRLRYLTNQTTLTTVTIHAREERDYVPPQAPSFTGRIANAWTGSLTALRNFGEGTVVFGVAAFPWAVPVICFLWFVRWWWKRRRGAAHGRSATAASH